MKFRLLLLLLLPFYTIGQSQVLPTFPNLKKGTLSNGLTYYALSTPWNKDRVYIGLTIRVGSMAESTEESGYAHFLEHMCFSSAPSFPGNEVLKFFQQAGLRLGTDVNATTSEDNIEFKLQLFADDDKMLAKGLTLMKDWAGGLQFSEEEIEEEKGIVIAEMSTSKKPAPLFLRGSSYDNKIILGTPESIRGITKEKMQQFYQKWFSPENMAVIFIGDKPVEDLEDALKKYLSSIPKSPNSTKRSYDNVIEAEAIDNSEMSSTLSFFLKYPTRELRTEEDLKYYLAAEVFKQVLYNRIVADKNSSFSCNLIKNTYFSKVPQMGLVTIPFLAKNNKTIYSSVAEILSTIEQISRDQINSSELDYAISQAQPFNISLRKQASLSDIAFSLYKDFQIGQGLMSSEQFEELKQKVLPTVKSGDIQNIATQLLKSGPVISGKFDQKDDFTLEDYHHIRDSIRNITGFVSYQFVAPPVKPSPKLEATPEKSLLLKSTVHTPVNSKKVSVRFRDDKMIYFILPNGLQVLLDNSGKDINSFVLSGNGGNNTIPEEYRNAFSERIDYIYNGAASFSGKSLKDSLKARKINSKIGITDFDHSISGSFPSVQFESILQYLQLVLQHPNADIAYYNGFSSPDKNIKTLSTDKLLTRREYLYGNSLPVSKTNAIPGYNEARKWFDHLYLSSNQVLYITGTIPDNAIEMINTYLVNGLKSSELTAATGYPLPDGKEKIEYYYSNRRNDYINLIFYHHNKNKLTVKEYFFTGILDRYYYNKINEVLRGKNSLIYNWGSGFSIRNYPTPYVVVNPRFIIDTSLSRQGLDLLNREIIGNASSLVISEDEFIAAKNVYRTILTETMNDPEQRQELYQQLFLLFDKIPASADELLDILKQVRFNDWLRFAETIINPSDYIILIDQPVK